MSVRFAVTESCAFKPAALWNPGGFGSFSSLPMSSCLRRGSLLGREVSLCDSVNEDLCVCFWFPKTALKYTHRVYLLILSSLPTLS